MPDPFADVDASSPEIIEMVAAGLETRAADPAMPPVIDACLDALEGPAGRLIVDIGSGAGGVTRRIAQRVSNARVLGAEPSAAQTARAQARGRPAQPDAGAGGRRRPALGGRRGRHGDPAHGAVACPGPRAPDGGVGAG